MNVYRDPFGAEIEKSKPKPATSWQRPEMPCCRGMASARLSRGGQVDEKRATRRFETGPSQLSAHQVFSLFNRSVTAGASAVMNSIFRCCGRSETT